MRTAIMIILCFCSISCLGLDPPLSKVRALYHKASTEEIFCKELLNLLANYDEKTHPLFFGYRAGATMMMANYVSNPFSKLSYFNKGKEMLQKAIDSDEKNIELRFLRFGIQTNAPSFLGYDIHISEDKTFLLQTASKLTDNDLKNTLLSYLKKSEHLSDHEKQQLK